MSELATCGVRTYYKPRGNEMVIPKYSSVPFEVVHLDFAEVKKKGEGVRRTQAFLDAIDECTRMAAAKCGKEDANSVIALMERVIFKTTKVLVSDNGPAFRSEKLRRWAEQRGITLRFSTPYHPEGNALAERLIRDLKKYLDLYPTFPGRWKCALEASVTHHNNTYTEGLGCSPYFCANGTSPWLPADHQLGIAGRVILLETPKTAEQQMKYKCGMKRNFDNRHYHKLPVVEPRGFILVKKGLSGSKCQFSGPYMVTKTASQQGILKSVYYETPAKTIEVSSVGNIIPYHPRRDGVRGPGECGVPSRRSRSGASTGGEEEVQ